jgi:pyruvate formate-lyase activating enzyme-like uncharacterized protein
VPSTPKPLRCVYCYHNQHLHLTDALQTEEATVKDVKDIVLDPEGFVHVAEDGIARSYARM